MCYVLTNQLFCSCLGQQNDQQTTKWGTSTTSIFLAFSFLFFSFLFLFCEFLIAILQNFCKQLIYSVNSLFWKQFQGGLSSRRVKIFLSQINCSKYLQRKVSSSLPLSETMSRRLKASKPFSNTSFLPLSEAMSRKLKASKPFGNPSFLWLQHQYPLKPEKKIKEVDGENNSEHACSAKIKQRDS